MATTHYKALNVRNASSRDHRLLLLPSDPTPPRPAAPEQERQAEPEQDESGDAAEQRDPDPDELELEGLVLPLADVERHRVVGVLERDVGDGGLVDAVDLEGAELFLLGVDDRAG